MSSQWECGWTLRYLHRKKVEHLGDLHIRINILPPSPALVALRRRLRLLLRFYVTDVFLNDFTNLILEVYT